MAEMLPLLAIVAVVVALAAVAALAIVLWRGRNLAEPRAAVMAELAQAQSATGQRLEAMIRMLGDRQSQLQTAVNDTAQKNITNLATQVTSLQSVLANKQERGAFGQARMEIIVQDGLPKSCYEFQYTLSNKMRPDCVVFLPGQRPLVIDAKFPLEAVTAYKEAKTDDDRRLAAARVRADMAKHLGDIADKYLIPGETQYIALMFVPSESLYADLQETFDDVVQKAFRAKVVIVSPSLLMVCIHLVQQMQKEERMREAAGQIQAEVGRLIDDVTRMHDRVLKLQGHFNQTSEDVRQIVISAEKVEKRGARIAEVEFDEDGAEIIPAPMTRKLEAGE